MKYLLEEAQLLTEAAPNLADLEDVLGKVRKLTVEAERKLVGQTRIHESFYDLIYVIRQRISEL